MVQPDSPKIYLNFTAIGLLRIVMRIKIPLRGDGFKIELNHRTTVESYKIFECYFYLVTSVNHLTFIACLISLTIICHNAWMVTYA